LDSLNRKSGFSLLEVLIALVVLAIAIIAIAKVQGLLIPGFDYAEQQSEAVNLARMKIEDYRNYESLEGSGNSYENIHSGSETTVWKNTTFVTSWTVTESATPPYKQINVRVTWARQDFANNFIELTSIIGKLDPISEGEMFQSVRAGGVRPT
jgi:prepilin-type N-terminal cleavage/methylation domain-containing protein